MMRTFACLFCCFCIVSHAGSVGGNGNGIPTKNEDELLRELNLMREQANVPLLAVATFKEGRVEVQQVLGEGSINTPLRWGSITKTFTGLALSKATRERDIDWHEPVRKIVSNPPWVNPWSTAHPVRVSDLANLCAGMSDLSFAEFGDNQPRKLEVVLAKPRSVLWPPGLQHSYTNVSPGLSAWLVEALAGEPFETYIAKHVFQPMGMPNASLSPVPGLPGGFKSDGVTEIPYWHMTFTAFGALNASLKEMVAAVQLMLNDELHPDDIRRLRAPGCVSENAPVLPIGYGAGQYGRVRSGFVWYGHGGDADGYRSRYALLPNEGRGYVVLINTDNPKLLRQIERMLESYLVEDLQVPSPPLSFADASVEQWLGQYYPSAARFGVTQWRAGNREAISIERVEGRLVVLKQETETELVPLGNGLFRRQGDPIATVRFVKIAGATFMQGELGNFVRLDDDCPGWVCS